MAGSIMTGSKGSEEQGGAATGEPEIERSITIDRTAEELSRWWLDPETLTRVMAGFATVQARDGGFTHWEVEGPLGHTFEWDTIFVNARPGEVVEWRSVAGADIPNEGSVRFSAAPVNRGTVATLRFRFNPPAGVLGDAAVKLLGQKPLDLAADGVLRRFKSLVETGEIPTTERQPAARDDTR